MAKAKSKKTVRKTSKKKVARKTVRKSVARKAASKRTHKVHPLRRRISNIVSYFSLFVALAVFFFSFESAVEAQRTAASMIDTFIVMP